jgi:hypothetical protein
MKEKGRNMSALGKTVASPEACGSGSSAMAASRVCVVRYSGCLRTEFLRTN